MQQSDEYWMRQAIALAANAEAQDEVPVGAVVVMDNQVIASGYNCPITNCDPTAHAEIVALRAAGKALGNYRLPGATLYVTLEPCAMCAYAMVHARIDRLVFAAHDEKTGAAGSVINLLNDERFNHQVEIVSGVLADEASSRLSNFFRSKRLQKKAKNAKKA